MISAKWRDYFKNLKAHFLKIASTYGNKNINSGWGMGSTISMPKCMSIGGKLWPQFGKQKSHFSNYNKIHCSMLSLFT